MSAKHLAIIGGVNLGIIFDASVMVPFLVDHELSQAVQNYRTRGDIVAPSLIFVETANAVWKYVKAGRANIRQLQGVNRFINQFLNEVVYDQYLLESAVLIAAENKHPVYDCLYLALARERSFPLITADKRLAALATKLSIETRLIRPTP